MIIIIIDDDVNDDDAKEKGQLQAQLHHQRTHAFFFGKHSKSGQHYIGEYAKERERERKKERNAQ